MITMIQPLPIGNALRVFLQPTAGAIIWRVLRKGSDTFTGPTDPDAIVAYEGDEIVFVDSAFLTNEVMAFYRPYYSVDGVVWTAGATASGTPSSTYEDYTTDVLQIVRERLEAGLLVEVQRGNLVNDLGYIQVFTAPPSLERDLRFPLVTIHLDSESSSGERAIGDNISGDEFDPVGFAWIQSEGWLASVRLQFIGWSLNSDERIELRKALRRIIIGNLAVFSDKGFEQIDLEQSDVDAVNGEFGAPMYQVMNTFTCLAPIRVGGSTPAIATVVSSIVEPVI